MKKFDEFDDLVCEGADGRSFGMTLLTGLIIAAVMLLVL